MEINVISAQIDKKLTSRLTDVYLEDQIQKERNKHTEKMFLLTFYSIIQLIYWIWI